MMNLYEFREHLRDKLLAGVKTATERTALADWVIANCPREQTTWEQIKKKLAELCEKTDRIYTITTNRRGLSTLILVESDDHEEHICLAVSEEILLEELTAMVKKLQPVTRQQAGEAWNDIGVHVSSEAKTLDAYFAQKEKDKD